MPGDPSGPQKSARMRQQPVSTKCRVTLASHGSRSEAQRLGASFHQQSQGPVVAGQRGFLMTQIGGAQVFINNHRSGSAQYGTYRIERGPAEGSLGAIRPSTMASLMIREASALFRSGIPNRSRMLALLVDSLLT